MKEEKTLINNIIRIACILLGNFIYALVVKLFLLPGGLVTGGSTGIALALNHLWELPVSTFVLIFNIVMLVVGFAGLGARFALTTILSSFAYPLSLAFLDYVIPEVLITDDVLLNTIFSGVGIGVSIGIVIRAGASTGGMDIPPLILNKYFKIPVSVSLYVFDTCILLSQAMFTGVERVLYGIVLVFIYTTVIDKVLLMGTTQTEVKIISSKSEEIRTAILQQMDRGITILNGKGGYLKEATEVILTVVSNREVPKIERIAREIDEEVFMTISKISEVRGRGFSLKKLHK